FGGPNIAREFYVNLMHIAGLLNLERQKFKELINVSGAKDTKTLFLAAVAAVGANNPNSAIALLQLSKLTDKN
ncbi:hypothetical protein ACI2BK_08710, partial [Campylobacter jejuni]